MGLKLGKLYSQSLSGMACCLLLLRLRRRAATYPSCTRVPLLPAPAVGEQQIPPSVLHCSKPFFFSSS